MSSIVSYSDLLSDTTNPVVKCFTYPRLFMNIVIGYDLGIFVANRYYVLGNSRTRELATGVLEQWASEHQRDIMIVHEEEPSKSKNMQEVTNGTH